MCIVSQLRKMRAKGNSKQVGTERGWMAGVVATNACGKGPGPPHRPCREKEPTVLELTYFLQLLKTMRHEIQIYDFLKSYLWIPKTIMFPSLM